MAVADSLIEVIDQPICAQVNDVLLELDICVWSQQRIPRLPLMVDVISLLTIPIVMAESGR